MTLDHFVNKFTIDPEKDVQPNFTLVKTVDAYISSNKKYCFNCGDSLNIRRLPSTAWTGVFYCWGCECLNVISYADGMSGNHLSTIRIFKEIKK